MRKPKCLAFILPSKSKNAPYLLGAMPILTLAKDVVDDQGWQRHGTPHDLFVVSDEEINVGDIVVNGNITGNNWAISEMMHADMAKAYNNMKEIHDNIVDLKDRVICKKIIATTATDYSKLIGSEDISGMGIYEHPNRPSKKFLKKFIEMCFEKFIIEVDVEYDIICDTEVANSEQFHNITYKLRVNKERSKENTINIKSVKTKWKRNEVITLLNKLAHDSVKNNLVITSEFKVNQEWLDKNL